MSRPHYDAATNRVFVAVNYPGTVGHVTALSLEDGRAERLADVKQPSIFTVTSLAWNPVDRTLFYTTDNYAHRDLMALDSGCLVRASQTHLLKARAAPLLLADTHNAAAMGYDGDRILVAVGASALIFDGAGKLQQRVPISGNASALALVIGADNKGSRLVVSYQDGTIELVEMQE